MAATSALSVHPRKRLDSISESSWEGSPRRFVIVIDCRDLTLAQLAPCVQLVVCAMANSARIRLEMELRHLPGTQATALRARLVELLAEYTWEAHGTHQRVSLDAQPFIALGRHAVDRTATFKVAGKVADVGLRYCVYCRMHAHDTPLPCSNVCRCTPVAGVLRFACVLLCKAALAAQQLRI